MKTYCKIAFLILATSYLSACKKDASTPVQSQLLKDSNITDSTKNWFFNYGTNFSGNPNNYAHSFSQESYASAPYALAVSCRAVKVSDHFCFWSQGFIPSSIPIGSKLTLKAKVKLEHVTGPGISLAIRGDKRDSNNQPQVMFFQSTESVTAITGNDDFKEYKLELDAYTDNVDVVYVFLVYLPNTTGTAYFDDITLTAN